MIIPFGGDLAWSDLSKDLLELPEFAHQLFPAHKWHLPTGQLIYTPKCLKALHIIMNTIP